MCSIPSALPISAFVFITYSWHLTRTGSAAPGFGKKEQVVDEQVSLTHLHGSTRKNKKRERVEITKEKKKKKRRGGEWRVPVDAVCNAAGRPPARSATEFQTCQSSWLSSLEEGKGKGEISQTFLVAEGPRLLDSPRGFHTRDSRRVPREVLGTDAHSITSHRTAYTVTKWCLHSLWRAQQHSFTPQTWDARPLLAKASCSQTSHCLQGDEQSACRWRVSKWETACGPCRFSSQKSHRHFSAAGPW